MAEKKLKPSQREKKRYLLLESKAGRKEIENAVLDFLGVLGYAKTGLMFVKSDVIAVNREEVDKVRAALCLSDRNIKVKRVSGSLKGLR